MKTLTEKVNGRRQWSFYGLSELAKQDPNHKDSGIFKAIIISNALLECGLKSTHDSRMFWLNQEMFVRVNNKGAVLICKVDSPDDEPIEKVTDPRTLFDRIRIVWNNCHG
jgi:hypothetical protein